MRLGKLSNDQLEKLIISRIKHFRSEVLKGPGIGVDCSVLSLGENLIVLSTDPITAASKNLGALTVHVCCNDAAAAGAEPVGLMVTLLAPPSAEPEDIVQFADELVIAAEAVHVEIIGGHTEVTDAVTRMVVSATVLGKVNEGKLITPSGIRPGDLLMVTKWAGLEGTAIIASEFPEKIKGILSEDEMKQAKNLMGKLSVVPEGIIAAKNGASAMHDVTEGGILGAVWELANAAGLGAVLNDSGIPIMDITKKICNLLGLDPLRLISSGCMLIACPHDSKVEESLLSAGIPVSLIGNITKEKEIRFRNGTVIVPPEADELYKII